MYTYFIRWDLFSILQVAKYNIFVKFKAIIDKRFMELHIIKFISNYFSIGMLLYLRYQDNI